LNSSAKGLKLVYTRCLKCETEFEKIQQKNQDLKRKVEDMNTALHEMGRENQSLQVCNS